MSEHHQSKRAGFSVLFLTEIWERFGFYTVASLLILYMTKALGFADSRAFTTFATFSALLYVTPLIGGYLADNVLGYQRTLLIGVVALMLGYVFLSIPNHQALYFGLALVIAGGGFFKSMPYALLGKLYESEPHKFDGMFTLYYLSINIGGIPAVIGAGVISRALGWNGAFAVAAVGLAIACATFAFGKRYFHHLGNEYDHRKVSLFRYSLIAASVIVSCAVFAFLLNHGQLADDLIYLALIFGLIYLGFAMRHLNNAERKRIVACLMLFAIGTVFFIFYYQAPTSLTLYVDRHVNRHLFGFTIPSSTYWVLNPIWIIALGPVLSFVYRKLGKFDPSMAMKFGLGIAAMGVGYYVIVFGMRFSGPKAMTSSWWIVGSYGFQSLAELFVSALGNGLASKYAPKHLVGVMIGMWFFSTSLGGVISGKLANLASINPHMHNPLQSLHVYQHAFMTYGNIALVVGLLTCAFAPLITLLSRAQLPTETAVNYQS